MAYLSMPAVARFDVRVGDINYGGHMGNDKALCSPSMMRGWPIWRR